MNHNKPQKATTDNRTHAEDCITPTTTADAPTRAGERAVIAVAQGSDLPLAEERARIAAAQAGDDAAMMQLITQYEPLLKRAAGQAHLRTIRDDALAEGCVSLVRAVRVYGDLRTLARRAIRTWQREATVDDRREEGFWELIEDESAAAALTRYERRALLTAAMRTLTPRERTVIDLLYFQETTQTAAAAQLGVSQQAVAAIKKRAIGKMRERMERG